METLTCRLLPWDTADGPTNMAADEVLVRTAAERGIASLRFYGWQPATLSLGYFQPAAARLADPRLSALPFVRRPSGGAALVHDREVTYALAVPAGAVWQAGGPWMQRMHQIILSGLSSLGLTAVQVAEVKNPECVGRVLCFQQFTPADLLCGGHKIVGSAQRKHCRALLQHGAILLRCSQHTPVLPGLYELTGRRWTADEIRHAVVAAFSAVTGWTLEPADWSAEEQTLAVKLAAEKYNSSEWNEKR